MAIKKWSQTQPLLPTAGLVASSEGLTASKTSKTGAVKVRAITLATVTGVTSVWAPATLALAATDITPTVAEAR